MIPRVPGCWKRRALVVPGVALGVVVLGLPARGEAQAGAGAPSGPILHEYLPIGPLRCEGGTCRRGTPSRSALPDAIEAAGALVSRPVAPPTPLAGEQVIEPQPLTPVVSGGSPPAEVSETPPERRDRVRMDRATVSEPPGTRSYYEAFNPAIFPFKRMTALDAVTPDEALVVGDPTRRRLEVLHLTARGADPAAGARDAFWGSVVIRLEPDRWVPLPSVAPDVRILAYDSDPPARLEFARDGADNVFVRGPVAGVHRLTWLEDAPRSYFGGPLPAGLRLGDEPRELVRPLPPEVARRAARFIAELGIDRRQPLDRILAQLVAWFRGFRLGAIAENTASTYETLARGQRGSCRHRSYAFTITALALGIPTRYIENELHVFVEVYVPREGWRRINLGGAPVPHERRNLEGKVAYAPQGPDPFAAPPDEGMDFAGSLGPGSGSGAPSSTGAGTGPGAGQGAGPGRGASQPGGTAATDPAAPVTPAWTSATPPPRPAAPAAAGARGAEEEPAWSALAEAAAARGPGVRNLTLDVPEAFRGQRVRLRGQLGGVPRPGGTPIHVELVGPDGLRVPIGDARAGDNGRFELEVELPRGLPLGRYRVVTRPQPSAAAP